MDMGRAVAVTVAGAVLATAVTGTGLFLREQFATTDAGAVPPVELIDDGFDPYVVVVTAHPRLRSDPVGEPEPARATGTGRGTSTVIRPVTGRRVAGRPASLRVPGYVPGDDRYAGLDTAALMRAVTRMRDAGGRPRLRLGTDGVAYLDDRSGRLPSVVIPWLGGTGTGDAGVGGADPPDPAPTSPGDGRSESAPSEPVATEDATERSPTSAPESEDPTPPPARSAAPTENPEPAQAPDPGPDGRLPISLRPLADDPAVGSVTPLSKTAALVRVRQGTDPTTLPGVTKARAPLIALVDDAGAPTGEVDGAWWVRNGIGTASANVGALSAWGRTRGAGATVATLDVGIDVTHPDLSDAISADGFNFVRGDTDLGNQVEGVMVERHGTAVAAVVAETGWNAVGSIGIAPSARVLPLVVGEATIDPDSGDLVEAVYPELLPQAIAYAVANGASVINGSFGVDGAFPASPDDAYCTAWDASGDCTQPGSLRDEVVAAMRAAAGAGVLLVFSAGNEAQDLDTHVRMPASAGVTYGLPNVVTVGASGPTDQRWSASSYGVQTVSLFAPGELITVPLADLGQETYGALSGTSYAAPMVAGAAALVKSISPDSDAATLRSKLLATVAGDPSGSVRPFAGYSESGGRLDAGAAVGSVPAGLQTVYVGLEDLSPGTGSFDLEITASSPLTGNQVALQFEIAMDGGDGNLLRAVGIPLEVAGESVSDEESGTWVAPLAGVTPGTLVDTATVPVTLSAPDGDYALITTVLIDGAPAARPTAARFTVDGTHVTPTPTRTSATSTRSSSGTTSAPAGSSSAATSGSGSAVTTGATATGTTASGTSSGTGGSSATGSSSGSTTALTSPPATTSGSTSSAASSTSSGASTSTSSPASSSAAATSASGATSSAPTSSSAAATTTSATSTPSGTTFTGTPNFGITSLSPSSGSTNGGQLVVVLGSRLPADPTVIIGGSVAEVVSHSATRLTFLTPQAYQTGPVNVEVLTRDQDGAEVHDTLSGAFTYYRGYTASPSTSTSTTRTSSATSTPSGSSSGSSTSTSAPASSSTRTGAPPVDGVTFSPVIEILGSRYRDLFGMLPPTCYLRCTPVSL